MLVLAIPAVIALVIALMFAVLLIAVVAGTRQTHPTDLALQQRTRLDAFAGWVNGLYVRRGEPEPRADLHVELESQKGDRL